MHALCPTMPHPHNNPAAYTSFTLCLSNLTMSRPMVLCRHINAQRHMLTHPHSAIQAKSSPTTLGSEISKPQLATYPCVPVCFHLAAPSCLLHASPAPRAGAWDGAFHAPTNNEKRFTFASVSVSERGQAHGLVLVQALGQGHTRWSNAIPDLCGSCLAKTDSSPRAAASSW
eukprot:1159287-Pelagomonas_calceolata.AAC.3